jgi:hypothetical protein
MEKHKNMILCCFYNGFQHIYLLWLFGSQEMVEFWLICASSRHYTLQIA